MGSNNVCNYEYYLPVNYRRENNNNKYFNWCCNMDYWRNIVWVFTEKKNRKSELKFI